MGLAVALLSLLVVAPASALQSTEAEADASAESADTAEPPTPTELADQGLVRLDGVDSGTLLLQTDIPGWYIPAPTLLTAFDVTVSGPIARTIVSQHFLNPADVFVEGRYVFPLPEGAAVDTLRMRVGDRWIEGQIEEREQARETFEAARAEGRAATLVEQHRPNVFTTTITNIPPNLKVTVEIEYQETLAPRDGSFGLRIPLVVAPRYTPTRATARELELTRHGWVTPAGPAHPTAHPTLGFAVQQVGSLPTDRGRVSIAIDLDAGFPLGPIDSPYHDVDINAREETSAEVTLETAAGASHDFYLSWAPDDLTEPFAAAFTEHRDDETYVVTVVTPPEAEALTGSAEPREVIFVQDTSYSMNGESLTQAKAGLRTALTRLADDDVFNIIEFNSTTSQFRPAPVQATPENKGLALAFVNDLEAIGGTEMLPALESALGGHEDSQDRLKQIIFLTDGAVDNERELLNAIERRLGTSRLFTVAIGSAPNSHFMTAAATAGRGSFVSIGDLNEVQDRMQDLFVKLESPAVVDLQITGLASDVDVSPSPLPDLYAGDPLVVMVRVPGTEIPDSIQLTGRSNGESWQAEILLDDAQERPGVFKLWARERIRDLEAEWVSQAFAPERLKTIDDAILETALKAGLVSRLTSLVAVDVEVVKPASDLDADESEPTDPPESADSSLAPEAHDRLEAADEQRVAESGDGARQVLAFSGASLRLQTALGMSLIFFGYGLVLVSQRRRW